MVGKRELLWRIDEATGRGRRRELMGDLYQTFTPGALPDTEPPAIPAGLEFLWAVADMKSAAGNIGAYFSWDDNTEADLLGYVIRVRTKSTFEGMGWAYDFSPSSTYLLDGLSYRTTASVGVAAEDDAGNRSDFCESVEFDAGDPPYWYPDEDGQGLPKPAGPSVSVDYSGKDAIFVVTAGSEQNITGVVYDLFL